jgi:hypothetical protein
MWKRPTAGNRIALILISTLRWRSIISRIINPFGQLHRASAPCRGLGAQPAPGALGLKQRPRRPSST